MNKHALIIIDIQNDYFDSGKLPLAGAISAAQQAASLLTAWREAEQPIIHIQHEAATPDLPFLQPNTNGQQIHPSVAPLQGETVITKHYPNAFWATDLESHLNSLGVTQLVICGMMTHMCVSATVRAGMERGYTIAVAHNACTTTALSFEETAIDAQTVHQTALAEISMLCELATSQQLAIDYCS